MPALHPAWDPPALVAGRTAGAAGDTRGARLLAGLHRQLVTTAGDRCQPVGTAEGARSPATPLTVSPHRDARAGLVVGTDGEGAEGEAKVGEANGGRRSAHL